MKLHVSPWKMGLMGGMGGYVAGLGSYLDQQRHLQAQLEAYRVKYGAQADVADLRAKNNRMIAALKSEANQRSYHVDTVGDDGTPVRVSYRNTYDPQTDTFQPHEIGRVPLSATQKQPTTSYKTFPEGDQSVTYKMNPDGTREKVSSGDRFKPAQDAQPSAKDRFLQDNLNKRTQLESSRKARVAADKAASQDVKDFKNLTQKEQAAELANYGIDPDAKDAIKQYREKKADEHLQAIQGGPAPAAAGNSADNKPSTTPQGQQIKYDSQGNAYIKGPDGKPVPYNPQASDSPLAMDQMAAEDQAQPEGDEEDGEQPQGQGLMASNEPDDESEESPDAEPDEDEDDQQGLMGGRQYA